MYVYIYIYREREIYTCIEIHNMPYHTIIWYNILQYWLLLSCVSVCAGLRRQDAISHNPQGRSSERTSSQGRTLKPCVAIMWLKLAWSYRRIQRAIQRNNETASVSARVSDTCAGLSHALLISLDLGQAIAQRWDVDVLVIDGHLLWRRQISTHQGDIHWTSTQTMTYMYSCQWRIATRPEAGAEDAVPRLMLQTAGIPVDLAKRCGHELVLDGHVHEDTPLNVSG